MHIAHRRLIMGSSHWTLTEILLLVFLHLKSHEAAQDAYLTGLNNNDVLHTPSVDFLLLTEGTSTVSPFWVQSSVPTFAGYEEDGHVSQSPAADENIMDSKQLLKESTKSDNVSLQTPFSIDRTANQTIYLAGSSDTGFQTVPQLPTSQWSKPELVQTASQFSYTAPQFTLATDQESKLSSNTSPFTTPVKGSYPPDKLNTLSASDVVTFPLFWASTRKTENDTERFVEKNRLILPAMLTTAENVGEMFVTEPPPYVISDTTLSNSMESLETSTEADRKPLDPLSEKPPKFPFPTIGNTDPPGPESVSKDSLVDSSFLDCLQAEDCDLSATLSTTPSNVENKLYGHSSLLPSQPIFIMLHSDWNTSVADWGIAWEALVYGSVGLFGSVTLLSLLSLFCLVFRCPSGGPYLAVLHLFLIFVGSGRAFSLFYDAYGHQERLPVFIAILLHELAFPCMTTSFSIVFLLLSSRCQMQCSTPRLLRLCILSAIVVFHFVVSAGTVVLVDFLHKFAFLLLVSHGVYIILTVLLSLSFFIFCCVARVQTTQIYDLKNSAPPVEYRSGCPFANAKDWSRATHIVLVASFFGLLNAVLQLYAVLYAMGYGGSIVFGPWTWWAFQLSSSLCEVGACLPLAVVGTYPLFSSNDIGRNNCWTKLFCLSPGHVTMKANILQANSQWSSSQHEKLLICDTIIRSDSEFFPLYTLVEKRMSLGEDISLIYNSTKSLEVQGLSHQKTPSFISVQVDSDSTVDFQPPSPINLRRSIDEALFSEALIPKSLFHGTALSSSLSLTIKSTTQLEENIFREKASDRGLYRTSSCMEIDTGFPAARPASTTCRQGNLSSPSSQVWRGRESTTSSLYKISQDGSSLALCLSSDNADSSAYNYEHKQGCSQQSKGAYHTLLPPSQESLDIATKQENSLCDDFKDVFVPIDAMSVSSDTIDL
ncbi:proline-rich transmembrane protein 4 [Xenopus laevis]|uniref:Proline-rich Transmembrane protein 4 n=2 Tax=Xenopus laevis TaxID=8355 RepID=A0A1L8GTL0_XENLA|nr:proline-rich transmembrane protein 4 [Xenopus laevis]XP_018111168.1 proline-rich transmembrane protein 4 [Xenopus laevis]OCT87170.1 hypothetical protein XELAEV_18020866mg [Xenopus laevis]